MCYNFENSLDKKEVNMCPYDWHESTFFHSLFLTVSTVTMVGSVSLVYFWFRTTEPNSYLLYGAILYSLLVLYSTLYHVSGILTERKKAEFSDGIIIFLSILVFFFSFLTLKPFLALAHSVYQSIKWKIHRTRNSQ